MLIKLLVNNYLGDQLQFKGVFGNVVFLEKLKADVRRSASRSPHIGKSFGKSGHAER